MPRFCAVHLPCLRVEIARRALLSDDEKKAPLAVVFASLGGPVQKELDLLGNTRLDEVSPDARAFGVRAGQTIAAARAKYADLRVRVIAVEAVRVVLAGIAEAALSFGATTSFDEEQDIVWVDVTGCAHLFGGEQALADRLADRVRAAGHACRVAVADGPRVAAAVARWAKSPGIVPKGANTEALAPLALHALPLDDGSRAWLSHVGMRTIGDLQKLPRASLAVRLGDRARVVMRLLEGEDGEPLAPYIPPEVPEERTELEYGITSAEALLFVAKGLCDRLAARLEGRGMAAGKLALVVALDRALVREGEETTSHLALSLPSPLARASDLLAVLRERVDSYVIAAPILAVTLRAPELARAEGKALSLFVAEAKAETALPRLVAELAASIGEARVGTLALADTWIFEERSRLVPLRLAAPSKRQAVMGTGIEPSRLLPNAIEVSREDLTGARLLARYEAVEWWRRGMGKQDVVAAWVSHGAHAGLGFVEIDRAKSTARVRGWLD